MKLSNIKSKVLIVDDDADIRNAVRLTLETDLDAKINFTEANNVASGIRALRKTKPDVVILDILMPGENGIDFLNRMNGDDTLPKSKVIILSAHGNLNNIVKIEKTGADVYHFIDKPFVGDELQALVLSLIVPNMDKYN